MRVTPIRYTADVAAAQRFWTALGLVVERRSRPGSWIELGGDGASGMALHLASAAPRVELVLTADEPLEQVRDRLLAAGFEPEPPVDESWGRSLRVRDPDGDWVQVNENDPELYT